MINTGQLAGQAALSYVGMKAVNAENSKIPHYIREALQDGARKALSSVVTSTPGAIVKLASAIIGGGVSKSISLNIATQIDLAGTITDGGSLKSFSLMGPGTQQVSGIGQIPYYNKPLGLFYFTKKPTIANIERRVTKKQIFEEYTILDRVVQYYHTDFIVNPELKKNADVKILSKDIVIFTEYDKGIYEEKNDYIIVNPFVYERNIRYPGEEFSPLPIGVRFYIEVKPKDGSPSSYIYKTVAAEIYEFYGGSGDGNGPEPPEEGPGIEEPHPDDDGPPSRPRIYEIIAPMFGAVDQVSILSLEPYAPDIIERIDWEVSGIEVSNEVVAGKYFAFIPVTDGIPTITATIHGPGWTTSVSTQIVVSVALVETGEPEGP